MLFAEIIIFLLGTVFVILGYILWKKEKISLLHSYHYDKVSEENKKPFCTLSGIGVVIIGISLLVTAVFLYLTNSEWSFISFGVGFCAGLAMLILAGMKYNHY